MLNTTSINKILTIESFGLFCRLLTIQEAIEIQQILNAEKQSGASTLTTAEDEIDRKSNMQKMPIANYELMIRLAEYFILLKE